MSGRAAQVETADGSAVLRPPGRRPQEEKLLERQLALKDVSFRQAEGPLDVERGQDLPMEDDLFQVGRMLGDGVHDRVAEGLSLGVPVAVLQVVRRVMDETGQDVLAGWSDGRDGQR